MLFPGTTFGLTFAFALPLPFLPRLPLPLGPFLRALSIEAAEELEPFEEVDAHATEF